MTEGRKDGRMEGRKDGRTEGRNDGRTEGGNENDERITPASEGNYRCRGVTYSRRMMPYERLEAWRVSHELALEIYRTSETWPKDELYGLTSQTRRAALSIPTNLAEGAAKLGSREFRRYLDISLGSLSELSYLLLFSRDRGLLPIEEWERLNAQRNRAGRLVWRLYRSIQRSARALG
jgi:four helix bundle protein